MTRTYSGDFNHNFNIRPVDFLNIDISNLREYILSASKDSDNLKFGRWFIFNTEKYQVLGFIGIFKDIVNLCNTLTQEEKRDSEGLLKDDKGRLTWGFIGIVIKDYKNNNDGKYIIPFYDFLWKIFLKNMKGIWNSTSIDSKSVPYYDYDNLENIEIDQIEPSVIFDNKKIYELNQDRDYKLFKYFLKSKDSNFSFCSNVAFYKNVIESPFSVLTTTYNNIYRLKEEKKIYDGNKDNQEEILDKDVHQRFQQEFLEEEIPKTISFFNRIFSFFKDIFTFNKKKEFISIDDLDRYIRELFKDNGNIKIEKIEKQNKLEIILVRK